MPKFRNQWNSYRMVIGIELRSSLSRSTCCTCCRKPTKWLLSISCASADNRGAHLLDNELKYHREGKQAHECAPFTIGYVGFHFIQVDFANGIAIFISIDIRPVHVNIHYVFRNHLEGGFQIDSPHRSTYVPHTLSRASLCSSLTIKIMSNRDRMVVWKSIFCRNKSVNLKSEQL